MLFRSSADPGIELGGSRRRAVRNSFFFLFVVGGRRLLLLIDTLSAAERTRVAPFGKPLNKYQYICTAVGHARGDKPDQCTPYGTNGCTSPACGTPP